ncbi:hypothetical protein SAVIM338S_00081 [Streptomyces avidinii]
MAALAATTAGVAEAVPRNEGAGPAASAAGAAAAPTKLRIMDWNIQGAQGTDHVTDISRIIKVIGQENPDIVTLQEVHDDTAVGKPNQWQQLLDALPQFTAHFAKSDYDGIGGNAGNLILSRFPIKERLTYLLPQYPANTDAVLRSLGGVRLDVGGTDVRVYTSHLSAGLGAEPTERRNRQARAIVAKLPADLMDTPMVFSGDLNIKPDDPIRPLFAGAGWNDTWTELHENIGASAVTHPGGTDADRIDYLYATPSFDVTAAHKVVTSASDHYPVVSDVSVRSPAVVKEGTVMAGPASASGWANVAASADGSATLRVCDNDADGWGVRAYVRDRSSASTVLTGADGAYADGCGRFTAPPASLPSPIVKVCLYRAGEEKNCRELTVT